MGGFYDGKLMIFSVENKKKNTLYPFIEEKPILCIEIDKEAIIHYYKKHGFAQAEVTHVDIEVNKERTGLSADKGNREQPDKKGA